MQISTYALTIILGCSLVTFLPRILPLELFSKMKIPESFSNWLDHVPIAIMAALIINELFIHNSKVDLVTNFLEILTAIPAFFIAYKIKSPILTVIVGVLTLMALRFFF